MVAIYGPNMTGVLSGAIVYEWIQEVNNYGLITYPDNTIQDGVQVAVGSPVPIQPDFNNLQSQWAAASPSSVSAAAYTPATTTFACPATTVGWTIDGNAALPGPPTSLTAPPRSTFISTSLPPLPSQGTTTGASSSSVETGAVSSTSTNTAGGSQATGTGAQDSTGTAGAGSASSSSSSCTSRFIFTDVSDEYCFKEIRWR
jgi:1,3-beta-glucanosyltransferase GAS1